MLKLPAYTTEKTDTPGKLLITFTERGLSDTPEFFRLIRETFGIRAIIEWQTGHSFLLSY